jgi:hypothetical protein
MAPDHGANEPGFGVGSEGEKGVAGCKRARPFVPGGAWIEAFEAQATLAMLRRVRRYASRLAQTVAHAGGVGGEYYVHELVQDALGDTLIGLLRWDPNVTTLEAHLCSRIRSRARHDRVLAMASGHESIDVDRANEDNDRDGGVLEEAEAALMPRQGNAASADYARRTVEKVRALARDDREVLAIVDAFDDGAESKADVMKATRLSARAYRNARDRLCRYGKHAGNDAYAPRHEGNS